MQSLYVIGPKRGPFKVGVATDPSERLAALQTGHHDVLLLHDSVETEHPYAAERVAHMALSAHRLRGEWFSCPLGLIRSAIRGGLSPAVERIDPPRTAEAFRLWREGRALSLRGAAEVIGCSKSSIIAYERGTPIPKYIGLACQAISMGLKPWE